MSVTEVVNAFSEPANKLIDAVSGAIGKAYEPRYTRKMADAKAYELKVISEEMRNNSDLPLVFDSSGSISVDISDFEALMKRAGKRIAYQEMKKQENEEIILLPKCDKDVFDLDFIRQNPMLVIDIDKSEFGEII